MREYIYVCEKQMILSEWLDGIRQLEGYVWVSRFCEPVCDSMKTLYLLAEETESVSTSVNLKVLCVC